MVQGNEVMEMATYECFNEPSSWFGRPTRSITRSKTPPSRKYSSSQTSNNNRPHPRPKSVNIYHRRRHIRNKTIRYAKSKRLQFHLNTKTLRPRCPQNDMGKSSINT